ncbi:MAG: hypothetical protein EZS28_021549, partial [Streblomastix strix]
MQIRHDVCEYIIQNRKTYQAGFDSEIESLEKYVQKMIQQGYYGDGRLFPAICAIYRVRVRVLMPGGIVFEDGDPTYPMIELGCIGHIHYVSIQRTQTKPKTFRQQSPPVLETQNSKEVVISPNPKPINTSFRQTFQFPPTIKAQSKSQTDTIHVNPKPKTEAVHVDHTIAKAKSKSNVDADHVDPSIAKTKSKSNVEAVHVNFPLTQAKLESVPTQLVQTIEYQIAENQLDEMQHGLFIRDNVDKVASFSSFGRYAYFITTNPNPMIYGDLCVIDFDINKNLPKEKIDEIRQNIIDNMLPANVGLVKTCHSGLHAYSNKNGYRLPHNRCIKCIELDNFEIDIFAQMYKHKSFEDDPMQIDLVQNRVVGPNTSIRETKNNVRETLKYETINDWAIMTHLANLRDILESWNVNIELPYAEFEILIITRAFGQQITNDGIIDKMNDALAQACVDGLKNLTIHNYPQPIAME